MEEKNYTTDAINLKSYDLSDADKIILMYSRDKGLVRGKNGLFDCKYFDVCKRKKFG